MTTQGGQQQQAMFPSTQPMDASGEPVPAAALSGGHAPDGAGAGVLRRDASATDLSSLSASLMQDLMRFEHQGEQRELLEVLAACVRHTQAIAVRLGWGEQEMTLSVFPLDGLVHCPLPMLELLNGDVATLRVLQVQPASLRPPGSPELARIGNPAFYAPLPPLLWQVALRGSRANLLPELAGQAAYRVAPGLSLHGLPVPPAMAEIIDKLSRRSSNLREIAEWYGIGRERAARLLNALYLQSGLIVSRSHPAATNEGWAGYR